MHNSDFKRFELWKIPIFEILSLSVVSWSTKFSDRNAQKFAYIHIHTWVNTHIDAIAKEYGRSVWGCHIASQYPWGTDANKYLHFYLFIYFFTSFSLLSLTIIYKIRSSVFAFFSNWQMTVLYNLSFGLIVENKGPKHTVQRLPAWPDKINH